MEPVEASQSGDYLSFYTHPSASMKIPNFNLFDTVTAAEIYDSTVNSLSNGNNKTNLHHTGQHIYSTNNDYTSSISISNGYWSYSTQPYLPHTTRQYMVNQASSASASDTSSLPTEQALSYYTHESYSYMQKMSGNYPNNSVNRIIWFWIILILPHRHPQKIFQFYFVHICVISVNILIRLGGPPSQSTILRTFVHHRRETNNRIEEIRRNGVLNPAANFNPSSTASISATINSSSTTTQNISTWTINENQANNDGCTCVICMNTYSKGETVNGLPHCTHFFHRKCIQAWLVGSNAQDAHATTVRR
ncbi:unnamed protein product [Rotaria sordida]|uniref:RING-type domain-containing protein n=1 Tax=Rotaria sordida TaxID=392033 RepID=A0A815ZNJ9_9BILA|nr:unnamed protein product [Rotaria sordida]CAF1584544.1 unnamed protein product [Rotaria sordida]